MTSTQAPQPIAQAAGRVDASPCVPLPRYATEVAEHLPGRRGGFVAAAPGRLDVIGGVAACSGAMSIAMPLERRVCVAVEPRTDDTVSIVAVGQTGDNRRGPMVAPLVKLKARVSSDQGAVLAGDRFDVRDAVFRTLADMCDIGILPHRGNGFSIAIKCALGGVADVGCSAARVAATYRAVCAAYDVPLDLQAAVALCVRARGAFDGQPVSVADAIGTLYASADALLQVGAQPGEPMGSIPLPPSIEVVGVDCGARREDAPVRYRRMQTAAMMGQKLIDRILAHEGTDRSVWGGYLARLTARDFVERFRDRLPTRLAGAEFLKRFGDIDLPGGGVEPNVVYKIRSRTEHQIYEHMRARQFAECVTRGGRNGLRTPFAEAGDLMYASHWSYGQRCGLGGVESEALVGLIRKHGASAGVFGAKITGRGCGGCVAVLHDRSERAAESIQQALVAYEQQTGCTPTLLPRAVPDALFAGAAPIA